MRLFYDVYSTRRRADLLLLGSDQLVFVSAIFFASGALFRPDAQIVAPLFFAWALIPRGVATFLGWFGRPHDFIKSLFLSTLLCLFICVLIFSGWELLWESSPYRIRVETAIAIIAAWCSGFLLFVPRAYKISDFLLILVVLLGLLEKQPYAQAFVPVFLFAFLLSSSTRRLTYGALRYRRASQHNLQNVRALSGVTTLLLFGLFAALSFGLYGLLDARAPNSDGRHWLSGDWRFLPTDGEHEEGGRQGFGSWGRDPVTGRKDAVKGDTGGSRQIGYNEKIGLSDLAAPRFDPKIIFAARVLDEAGEELAEIPNSWTPNEFLWRGAIYSHFDSTTNSWSENKTYEKKAWTADARIEQQTPESGADPGIDSIHLEVIVIQPIFRNLVSPYFTEVFGPLSSIEKGSVYYESNLGELFPDQPPLHDGNRYRLLIRPHPTNSWPGGYTSGTHEDARYLELPGTGEVSIDLPRKAARLGLVKRSDIQGKLSRLREYMQGEFKYSNQTSWRGGADKLQVFLEEEKIGDCVYFATSTCLLLRAAGVSTRIVVGFSGGEIDPSRPSRVYVRNFRAHSWTEVYFPGRGWYPLDATAWVPAAASYQPPELKFADEQKLAELPDDGASRRLRERRNSQNSSRDADDPDEPWKTALRGAKDDREFVRELFRAADQDDIFAREFRPATNEEGSSWAQSQFPWRQATDPTGDGGRASPEASAQAGADGSHFRVTLLRSALLVFTLIAGFLLLLTLLRPKDPEDENEEDRDEDEDGDEANQIGLRLALLESLDESNMNSKEELLLVYHRLQQRLVKTRNHRRSHQTPREHGNQHIGSEDDLDRAIDVLNSSVYQTLYGGEEPTLEEIKAARHSCRKILRYLG